MLLKTGKIGKVENGTGLNFRVPVCSHDIRTLIKEKLDGIESKFDYARLLVDVEGKPTFGVSEAGTRDVMSKSELVGIIVDEHLVNSFYASSKYVPGARLDCRSLDGVTGYGNPGGSCRTCSLNQFGTGIGSDGCLINSKACQNKLILFLHQSGDSLPLSLTVPTGSFGSFSDYLKKHIVSKGRRSYEVVTRITLREGYSEEGSFYPELQFEVKEVLDDESSVYMREYSRWIHGLTRQLSVWNQPGGEVVNGEVKS